MLILFIVEMLYLTTRNAIRTLKQNRNNWKYFLSPYKNCVSYYKNQTKIILLKHGYILLSICTRDNNIVIILIEYTFVRILCDIHTGRPGSPRSPLVPGSP